MNRIICCITLNLVMGVCPVFLKAQSGIPVKISLFSESTSVPFNTFLSNPIHPGLQVGTEFDWRENAHLWIYPAINIGYMFHNKLFQGIYANIELGFDYKFNFGLNVKSALGLGYLHTFSTRQEFQFTNGQYQSKNDKGNSRLMPSVSLGLGYRLNPSDPQSTEIFIIHQTWLEYPYSPGFIPVMSHTNTHIGSRFYPFKNN